MKENARRRAGDGRKRFMSETRQTYADLKDELLLTREQIAARVREMGR